MYLLILAVALSLTGITVAPIPPEPPVHLLCGSTCPSSGPQAEPLRLSK